ncbi:elongation factor EF-1 gamma subunit [Savitreella phatthalungensis]
MSIANTEILPTIAGWFAPLIGRSPYNKKNVEDAEKRFNTVVGPYLEKYLANQTYLVGHRLTLADLVVAAHLARGYEYVFGDEWQEKFPNITRFFKTVVNQKIYKSVAGDVPITKEAVKYTPPAKEKKEPAAKGPAQQPKQAKKPKDDDEEEEPLVPQEKKAKHPLESAPTGSLVLDEWKRQYSNNDTREVALPWFFENLDKENYSVWRVDYKYNDELTQVFMSSNLVGGFFSRLEASRKFIFGAMSVYGESNNSVISGAFVIRGQDYLPAFDVAPDFESYEFKKLDITDAKDKTFIEDAWSWDKPVEVAGKSYDHADGKVFK